MDRNAASAIIQLIFARYRQLQAGDVTLLKALTTGKLYELFVLSKLVDDLSSRGFGLAFRGNSLKFKASPGRLISSDPHFDVTAPRSWGVDFWIFVDIEFETLGCGEVTVSDNSRRHELDILVLSKISTKAGYPDHSDIALGIECKSTANFTKGLVKEALGIRRELSFFSSSQSSALTAAGGSVQVDVPANPPSEFWLAFVDAKGKNYSQSPAAFGIDFRHLEP